MLLLQIYCRVKEIENRLAYGKVMDKSIEVPFFLRGVVIREIYLTLQLYDQVLRWWFLCALEKQCIAPIAKTGCNNIYSRPRHSYANCHRFDQSSINILLANYFDDDDLAYFIPDARGRKHLMSNKRGRRHKLSVTICGSAGIVTRKKNKYYLRRLSPLNVLQTNASN